METPKPKSSIAIDRAWFFGTQQRIFPDLTHRPGVVQDVVDEQHEGRRSEIRPFVQQSILLCFRIFILGRIDGNSPMLQDRWGLKTCFDHRFLFFQRKFLVNLNR